MKIQAVEGPLQNRESHLIIVTRPISILSVFRLSLFILLIFSHRFGLHPEDLRKPVGLVCWWGGRRRGVWGPGRGEGLRGQSGQRLPRALVVGRGAPSARSGRWYTSYGHGAWVVNQWVEERERLRMRATDNKSKFILIIHKKPKWKHLPTHLVIYPDFTDKINKQGWQKSLLTISWWMVWTGLQIFFTF